MCRRRSDGLCNSSYGVLTPPQRGRKIPTGASHSAYSVWLPLLADSTISAAWPEREAGLRRNEFADLLDDQGSSLSSHRQHEDDRQHRKDEQSQTRGRRGPRDHVFHDGSTSGIHGLVETPSWRANTGSTAAVRSDKKV